ncbi:hypothetical protein HK101_001152 [Irineochytrium annulatum]|nr:hypothetical protein HK101_001152 [Irineochytrium annulatum]
MTVLNVPPINTNLADPLPASSAAAALAELAALANRDPPTSPLSPASVLSPTVLALLAANPFASSDGTPNPLWRPPTPPSVSGSGASDPNSTDEEASEDEARRVRLLMRMAHALGLKDGIVNVRGTGKGGVVDVRGIEALERTLEGVLEIRKGEEVQGGMRKKRATRKKSRSDSAIMASDDDEAQFAALDQIAASTLAAAARVRDHAISSTMRELGDAADSGKSKPKPTPKAISTLAGLDSILASAAAMAAGVDVDSPLGTANTERSSMMVDLAMLVADVANPRASIISVNRMLAQLDNCIVAMDATAEDLDYLEAELRQGHYAEDQQPVARPPSSASILSSSAPSLRPSSLRQQQVSLTNPPPRKESLREDSDNDSIFDVSPAAAAARRRSTTGRSKAMRVMGVTPTEEANIMRRLSIGSISSRPPSIHGSMAADGEPPLPDLPATIAQHLQQPAVASAQDGSDSDDSILPKQRRPRGLSTSKALKMMGVEQEDLMSPPPMSPHASSLNSMGLRNGNGPERSHSGSSPNASKGLGGGLFKMRGFARPGSIVPSHSMPNFATIDRDPAPPGPTHDEPKFKRRSFRAAPPVHSHNDVATSSYPPLGSDADVDDTDDDYSRSGSLKIRRSKSLSNAKALRVMGMDPTSAAVLSPPPSSADAKALRVMGLDTSLGVISPSMSTGRLHQEPPPPATPISPVTPNPFGGQSAFNFPFTAGANAPPIPTAAGTNNRNSRLSNSVSSPDLQALTLRPPSMARRKSVTPSEDSSHPSLAASGRRRSSAASLGRRNSLVAGLVDQTVSSLLNTPPTHDIVSGHLFKHTPQNVFRPWKRRFFILSPSHRKLFYFRSDSPEEMPMGFIPVNLRTDVASARAAVYKGKHVIQITGEATSKEGENVQRAWYLMAEEEADKRMWMQGLVKTVMNFRPTNNTEAFMAPPSPLPNNRRPSLATDGGFPFSMNPNPDTIMRGPSEPMPTLPSVRPQSISGNLQQLGLNHFSSSPSLHAMNPAFTSTLESPRRPSFATLTPSPQPRQATLTPSPQPQHARLSHGDVDTESEGDNTLERFMGPGFSHMIRSQSGPGGVDRLRADASAYQQQQQQDQQSQQQQQQQQQQYQGHVRSVSGASGASAQSGNAESGSVPPSPKLAHRELQGFAGSGGTSVMNGQQGVPAGQAVGSAMRMLDLLEEQDKKRGSRIW